MIIDRIWLLIRQLRSRLLVLLFRMPSHSPTITEYPDSSANVNKKLAA
jgi:hypothetical protein